MVRRLSIAVTTLLLLLGAAAFLLGSCLCAGQPDYREAAAQLAPAAEDAEEEPSTPLLAEDAQPSHV
jgi:hypothetical protein